MNQPYTATKKQGNDKPYDGMQPHDIAAEEAVLGAILIDPDAIIRVSKILRPEHFFLSRNGCIYGAMLELLNERKPLDLVVICDKLTATGELKSIGGSGYLTDLIDSTPTSIGVVHYAEIVKRLGTLRGIIKASTEIAQAAYNPEAKIEDVSALAQSKISSATVDEDGNGIVMMDRLMTDFGDNLQEIISNPELGIGMPSGLKDLDKLLGGFKRKNLIIIGARPGMGKTSLAVSIALQSAKVGKRVVFFSLEMSSEELSTRMVANHASIDSEKIQLGEIGDEQWTEILKAQDTLSQYKLGIDDTAGLSVAEMNIKLRQKVAELGGVDLVIVDYLQLMKGAGKIENRQQDLSDISRGLKILSKEFNCPVIALSQLNRGVEMRKDKRPILSDLRDSGAIEQDADVVVLLYRDGYYNPESGELNIVEINIAKRRLGKIGMVRAYARQEFCQFLDLTVRTEPLDY